MPKPQKPIKIVRFSPGTPVEPKYFVGREEQIEKIMQRAHSSSVGKQKHIFVTGQRALGKSSLCKYVQALSQKEFDLLGVYANLADAKNLEEMTETVFQAIVNELNKQKNQNWMTSFVEKTRDFFSN